MQGLFMARSFGSSSDGRLIAAGPLTQQPGTPPYRIVLLKFSDKEFSVHTEMFNDGILDEIQRSPQTPGLFNSFLHTGSYFRHDFAGSEESALMEATKKFTQRLADNCGFFLSLGRQSWTAA